MSLLPLPSAAHAVVCEVVVVTAGVFAQLGSPHSSLMPGSAGLSAWSKGR